MVHYTHERLTDAPGSFWETGTEECTAVPFAVEPVPAAAHPKNTLGQDFQSLCYVI
jgi:hypothetical protein